MGFIRRALDSILKNEQSLEGWSLPARVAELVTANRDGVFSLNAACRDIEKTLGSVRVALLLIRGTEVEIHFPPASLTEEGAGDGQSAAGRVCRVSNEKMSSFLSAVGPVAEVATPSSEPAIEALLSMPEAAGLVTAPGPLLVAALSAGGRRLGALLAFDLKHVPSRKTRALLQAVAAALALALHQAGLYEKERSAANREAIINRLLTAIRSAAGIDEIFKVAVEGAGTALGVSRAALYLYSDDTSLQSKPAAGQSAALLEAQYLAPDAASGATLDIGGSMLLGRLSPGSILSISDTVSADSYIRAIGVRLGVRALTLAPIVCEGRIAAVLALEQHDRPREFSEDETKLVRLVAEQTAIALRQAELYKEAREAATREALIGRITSAMHRSLDQDIALQTIVDELGKALSICRCRLTLLPDPLPDTVSITHEYTAPCCADTPSIVNVIAVAGNEHLKRLLASPTPVAVDDVSLVPALEIFKPQFQAEDVRSILASPISLGGRPIGVFFIQASHFVHAWTRWEIELVQSVAEQAAVAIRQVELYNEARESATRAALVNQIVGSIRRSLDLEETLLVAVQELGRALRASRVLFRKIGGDKVSVLAEYLAESVASLRGTAGDASDYEIQNLVRTRRTMVIDDIASFTTAHPALASTVGAWRSPSASRSEIVCPIFIDDRLWGAFSIAQTDRVRRWTASEISLVEAVTAQIEVAVSHSRLFEEAREGARREGLVSRIIHGINQSNQLDEIFTLVLKELGDYLGCDSLLIAAYYEEAGTWLAECEYRSGVVSSNNRAEIDGFAEVADQLRSGPYVCNDVELDPNLALCMDRYLWAAGTRALVIVPVEFGKGRHLRIIAEMKARPRVWTQEELEVLTDAADRVLIALERASLFEQVLRGKHDWESTFDALVDGIFIFDRAGALRRVNAPGAAMEGRSVEEILGRPCCSLLRGSASEICRVSTVIETGRPVTYELVPKRLERTLLVTISPIWPDPLLREGKPAGTVCVVRDLSELRAAEAAAREQRGFLIKLIEHANDAIFALSPGGKFIWFNEQLVKLLGYSRAELFVSEFKAFLPEEDQPEAADRFEHAMAGAAQTFEVRGTRKNGGERLLQVTYTPVYDKGKVTSVLCLARDITEERLAAERAAQADKLRALGQLASGVAHNFNNILAAILGHAQLAKRDLVDDRLSRRMDVIEQAALDGAQTVKRIQGFAIQQNDDTFERIDINQLVQDSTNLTRARWADEAQASGLPYEVELKLQQLPPTRGSASELREVFVNIILNALDAMPQGGRLSIATQVKRPYIQISFSDDGVGMSRPVRERIFEPFFTTKGAGGMGLGLAVSYSTVERHEGRIEVASNPGRGSTFTISLPIDETAVDRTIGAIDPQIRSASILVVDDDHMVREALVGMLSSAGHLAEQAAGGREGLALMEARKFNLVMTDLAMPEMDGWALASEIKRRWPESKIVLVTGYRIPSDTIIAHRDLVNAVIYKPIRLDDITSTVSRVLSATGD